jgi:hypothetical protein
MKVASETDHLQGRDLTDQTEASTPRVLPVPPVEA